MGLGGVCFVFLRPLRPLLAMGTRESAVLTCEDRFIAAQQSSEASVMRFLGRCQQGRAVGAGDPFERFPSSSNFNIKRSAYRALARSARRNAGRCPKEVAWRTQGDPSSTALPTVRSLAAGRLHSKGLYTACRSWYPAANRGSLALLGFTLGRPHLSTSRHGREHRAIGSYLPDPSLRRPPGWSSVAATAGSVGRETEDLRFANLAARVAAAARRVIRDGHFDPRRDEPFLRVAEELLRTGAATLNGETTPYSSDSLRQESYAFARLTHSALSPRTVRSTPASDPERRRKMASELEQLADDVAMILTEQLDSDSSRKAAEEIRNTFGRISSSVLRELGRPGDSLGRSPYSRLT